MATDASGIQSPPGRWRGFEPTLLWLAVFVLLTLGLQMWPGASELLRFDRTRFEGGVVWQLLTSQWVHLSGWHAVGNALGFVVIVVASRFWVRWPLQVLALGGGYAGVALVLALDPDCRYYAGASGALHGLLAGNAMAMVWSARPAFRPETRHDFAVGGPRSSATRLVALTVLAAMAVKLWLQMGRMPQTPLAGWGFPVYHPAHVAGALGGMGLVLLVLAARALMATNVQAQPGQ